MQMSDLANNCVVYLMYNPVRSCVSEKGIKISKTRQPFRKSFGIKSKQCVNIITFSHFKIKSFRKINRLLPRTSKVCLPFFVPVLQNRKIRTQISFLHRGSA